MAGAGYRVRPRGDGNKTFHRLTRPYGRVSNPPLHRSCDYVNYGDTLPNTAPFTRFPAHGAAGEMGMVSRQFPRNSRPRNPRRRRIKPAPPGRAGQVSEIVAEIVAGVRIGVRIGVRAGVRAQSMISWLSTSYASEVGGDENRPAMPLMISLTRGVAASSSSLLL